MIVRMKNRRHPRQGPSCLLVMVVLLFGGFGVLIAANAGEVREMIIPTPTAPPTRTAIDYAARGKLLTEDGELEEAIDAYLTAIELDGNQVGFYIPLITLLTATGRADEALNWADQAMILAPNNDEVWAAVAASSLANADRLLGIGDPTGAGLQYVHAADAAQEAIELNPQNATAHAYLAGALMEQGVNRYQAAQESAELAIAIDPENAVARQYMARILELQGYYGAAIEQYEYALALDPPNAPDLYIGLAYNYYATQDTSAAIISFQSAVDADPDNADAYEGLGYMYFLIGEYPRAEEFLTQAAELDPNMVRAQAHLGATLFRQFNYETAIEHLENAVVSYGQVSPATATYFNMLGLAYFRTDQSRCDEAIPLFEAVLVVADEESFNYVNAQEGIELCRTAALENP